MNVFYIALCISIVTALPSGGVDRAFLKEGTNIADEKSRERRLDLQLLDHCPNGATRHDNSCYMMSHNLANWPDALVYCEAYAAHLVTIDSASEQLFVAGQLKNIGSGSTDPDHYYWMGGTDAISEGEWYWAKTIERVQYTNWKPGEPNNNNEHSSHHQDCLAIYADTGLWDDGWCETLHNFICEIDLDPESVFIG